MRNPFKKDPPPPIFDPFEIAEETAKANAKIQEMGLAEDRLIKATKRAIAATKEAKDAYERLEASSARARTLGRTGGRKW